ncbi:MAG: hypothetical protein IJA52_07270 [Clostridia bacterium]|nr:hypothetical protein [Clostridia bacterium]
MRDLPVFVINHQDLTWRRCFDRPLEFRGESFVSYAHLQELYILENLKNAREHPEYKFMIECVATLGHFLRNNPEYKDEIGTLLSEGRLFMPLTGHNITDSNLIAGESIVRSYLYGYNYLKENFGYTPEGFDRNDSFGNSGNLPQIARGFGTDWVYNVVYTDLTAPYWKGIDGTVIANVDPVRAAISGGYAKYRPCQRCHGYDGVDCPECNNTRIDIPFAEQRRFDIWINDEKPQSEEVQGLLYVSSEELLPSEKIFDWIENNKEKYNIYYSNYKELADRYYKGRIENIDKARDEDIYPSREVNGNNSGVFVSRIRTKQRVRKNESRAYALEALDVMDSLGGGEEKKEEFNALWDKMLFTMFHDAVTGTMVDAAYRELMDIHDDIDNRLTGLEDKLIKKGDGAGDKMYIINPYGMPLTGDIDIRCPKNTAVFAKGERLPVIKVQDGEDYNILTVSLKDIPPYGTLECNFAIDENAFDVQAYRFKRRESREGTAVLRNDVTGEETPVENGRFTVENEYYKICADMRGILSVYDKEAECEVARAGEYRVGEWILEHDEGSPWATLSTDMRRMPMASATHLEKLEKTADCQRLTYSINKRFWGYAVDAGHDIKYTVSLVKGLKRILFSADVYWATQNHRLRIAFPTSLAGRHIYEIPYGYIERKPYENNCVWPHGASNWASAAGDWPAANFAGIESEKATVAVLNRGTPSYQINKDKDDNEVIFLSVLRSPSVGTYLHEPLSYTMTDYDGMRDEGYHHFDYALISSNSSFAENSAVLEGQGYNATLYATDTLPNIPALPKVESEDVRVSALKRACDGNGFIMRLFEYHGKDSRAAVSVPEYVKTVYETDLKEDIIRELPIVDGKFFLDVGAFKIKTLKFML